MCVFLQWVGPTVKAWANWKVEYVKVGIFGEAVSPLFLSAVRRRAIKYHRGKQTRTNSKMLKYLAWQITSAYFKFAKMLECIIRIRPFTCCLSIHMYIILPRKLAYQRKMWIITHDSDHRYITGLSGSVWPRGFVPPTDDGDTQESQHWRQQPVCWAVQDNHHNCTSHEQLLLIF